MEANDCLAFDELLDEAQPASIPSFLVYTAGAVLRLANRPFED